MLERSATFILVGLLTVAIGQNPRADPVGSHIFVQNYGSCAQVTVEQSTASPSVIIDMACHGWSVEQCDAQMLIRSGGVRIDTGNVLYNDGRRVDVAENIGVELEREGDEYLHLQFLQPVCTASGFDLPFSGSRIGLGEQGSANELSGLARIRNDAVQVVFYR